jgi:capsular exopolysaccharide synthesis family protein
MQKAQKPVIIDEQDILAMDPGIHVASQNAVTQADALVVPFEDLRRIRLPRNEERSVLLMQYDAAMQGPVEAYRTLRTRLLKHQAKHNSRSFVVTSAARGEGKSLTVFNLALCCANVSNSRVLAIDADLRCSGLSSLLGDPDPPGLGEVLEGRSSFESAVVQTDIPNLYVVSAGTNSSPPPELFAGSRWKDFIHWSTQSFPLILVDCPEALHMADCELITAPCNAVLVVTRARRTELESMTKLLAQLDTQKIAGVIFNAASDEQRQA